MPGRASPEVVAKYRKLRRDKGYSQAKAAKAAGGMSEQWGYLQDRKDRYAEQRRIENEGGEPKTYADLDGGVKDTLKDFNLFREVFFCRDKTPWVQGVAEQTVEWLLDKTQKTHVVANVAPGSGKSTLWCHDLIIWLICGGGAEDPAFGRAIRVMLGSETKHVSIHNCERVRNSLERHRPYYDKESQRTAELTLLDAFGRFRPLKSLSEWDLWKRDQFVVAQIGDLETYEKEPTVQAASKEAGFLGDRVNIAVWDDLVTSKNCRNSEVAEALVSWTENEAEPRVERGGVFMLVGQRLSNLDLYRNRIDIRYTDEHGESRPVYRHVTFPAHNEKTCPNGGQLGPGCRQWDGFEDGCLLDEVRLSWKDLLKAQSKGNYRTVFGQEDQNPEDVLVHEAWIYGGTDANGFEAMGCLDHERGFYEWPTVDGLVDVCCVDPSATKFWAFEWWALEPVEPFRSWLIWGQRKKMMAGTDSGFLDWNPSNKCHVGAMEEIQQLSGELGHSIRAWVVEQNAAHRYLFQTHAFQTWQQKWPRVAVFPHQTQGANKLHDEYGVSALLPYRYKLGLNRLPYAKGTEIRNYMRYKVDELTKYPDFTTDDTVMANWFANVRQQEILHQTRVLNTPNYGVFDDSDMPPYLAEINKHQEIGYEAVMARAG